MAASPRRTGSALLGILGIAVVSGLMLTAGVAPALALTAAGTGTSGLFAGLPEDLKIQKFQQKTQIFAKNGKKDVLLASFYNQNREVIGWDDVPATVKNATLAAEDTRYFEHGGVDPMGILRAVVSNVTHGGGQGASTISQQYVKNVCIQEAELLPTQPQVEAAYAECTGGIQRKLREARNAIGLEKIYSKKEILLGYLNIAGFGGRIYGIESAAQYYFGTHAKDLSVAQAASLMAIVNNPNYLRIDEKANIPANKLRRDYILDVELKQGWITKAQHDDAIATAIKPKITPTTAGCAGAGSAAYFCSYVVSVVKNDPIFGRTAAERYTKLQSSGWKIYTTLDVGLQKKANVAMADNVPRVSPAGSDLGGAAVSVQVGTGRILSMVQSKRFDETDGKDTKGANYTATSLNWNTDFDYGGSGGFQPGSTYKAFTLIDWLQHGHGLNEIVDGTGKTWPAGSFPSCEGTSGPFPAGNDTANEGGYQTVMQGTALSVNGVFASMASKLNLCDIRTQAQKLLVHRADGTPLQVNPSSILGTNEVAPLTMATAYAGIADKGNVCAAVAIDKIVDSSGGDVAIPKAKCEQGISPSIAVATGYALHGVLTGGTASVDRGATGSAWGFAKTGTTNDAKSTWVVGGTTKVVTAVWVGNVNAQKTNLRYVYGWSSCGKAADARHCVWSDIMAANQAKYPGDTSWPTPESQYLYGQKIAVPDVSGQVYKDAKATLQKAGFQVKKGGSTASDTVPAGSVVSSDPAAQSQVVGGAVITLTISSGPEVVQPPAPATGTVPQVTGMTTIDAKNTLAASGYASVTVGQVPNSTGTACTVIGQLPAAGSPADPATTIALGVPNDPSQCS
ncbi:transglycosylase domain-containing protein [uncultured Amnibacterium sp.]|uniref:transglycosylase domain-containing protein n=1 Tax=uncultured Amnibacterium sp. TaxID=1631851 RepID=UPI0035C9689B